MKVETIKVWDLAVRVFHWSLVALFAIAWLSGEDEGNLHIYSGYAVIGLLVFRLLWGIIGPRHARFSDFVYGPSRVLSYLKGMVTGRPDHYVGHNPAGGWMIVALLISLAATSYTGLKVYGVEGQGPLADGNRIELVQSTAWADEDEHGEAGREGDANGEEFWEEVHEFFAYLTLFLIVFHVGGVIASSYLHRENLIKSMITGKKTVER